MLQSFYRWRYHHRRRKATKQRLSGRRKARTQFHLFTHSAFKRPEFGKYDRSYTRSKKWRWLIILPLLLIFIWFIWESFKAVGFFQP